MKRVVVIGILLLASAASADIIVETDGTRVEGKISRTSDGWTVTQDDGKVVNIDDDKVASVQPGKAHSDGADAIDRLDSLRRTVDHMSDIHQIITKYELFISQNSDPTALGEANKDLSNWHDRLDRGLVKLGDKWMTPRERENRREVAQSETSSALDMVRHDRPDDAEPVLKQAVLDDPQNAPGFFLLGVIYYNKNALDKSQAAFESANAAAPGDGPTLNNLAVIAARHRSFLKSIDYYLQAMTASPENRVILDNVAESLNAVPLANQHAPILAKAAALFQQQDPILQQTQARAGYYRWGSTWVTIDQLNKLKALEGDTLKQLDKLQQASDQLQTQINTIDQEIDSNTREMHRLEASTSTVDTYGNTTQQRLPQVYFDLQNDNTKLQANKKDLQDKQTNLKNQAKMIQIQMPAPPFSGIHHIFGIEVLAGPAVPSTQPNM